MWLGDWWARRRQGGCATCPRLQSSRRGGCFPASAAVLGSLLRCLGKFWLPPPRCRCAGQAECGGVEADGGDSQRAEHSAGELAVRPWGERRPGWRHEQGCAGLWTAERCAGERRPCQLLPARHRAWLPCLSARHFCANHWWHARPGARRRRLPACRPAWPLPQTNVSVCSSLGHPFVSQFNLIFLDMLAVYK